MADERMEALQFMDVKQLSEFLSVPETWVYARTASGEIPHVKLGHYVRFRPSEVIEWLDGCGRAARA